MLAFSLPVSVRNCNKFAIAEIGCLRVRSGTVFVGNRTGKDALKLGSLSSPFSLALLLPIAHSF